MEVARDLIRDLVGILFPGGLLVTLTLWAFWAITAPFSPLASSGILTTDKSIIVLLIISYVAGQSLRIKQLKDIEDRCTEEYRKIFYPQVKLVEWEEFVKDIDKEAKDYFSGVSSIERLKDAYRQYLDKFGLWEQFPYGYRLTARRLLEQPENYIQFFEKYDKQNLTKTETFFNYCKSVIYEYSPSFKEEVLRQEALVRLFAGIYYVVKYGKVLAVIVGTLHLAIIVGYYSKFKPDFLHYQSIWLSHVIVLGSLIALSVFVYMNNEILQRLRYMRAKELNLAHDGFYLVCKKNNLDL
jgi:hypothetical protein